MKNEGNLLENLFQHICDRITGHKFRKLESWSEGITPQEFHYRCKICGYHFWNFKNPADKKRKGT